MLRFFQILVSRLKLHRKMKRAMKKKGSFSFRVRSVREFFLDLNAVGFRYVVLRWPDQIHLDSIPNDASKDLVDSSFGDVDLLVDLRGGGRERLLAVGEQHFCENGIKCEFYCSYGSRGFSYLRFPYYPPVMAECMLGERMLDERGFYRLLGVRYIESLVYHVLYHKAAALCSFSGDRIIEDYFERIRQEANKSGVTLSEQLSLDYLHSWLVARGWDMPYDLKVRWPLSNGWMRSVISIEQEALLSDVPDYNYFCVFVLRDDLEAAGLLDEAVRMIGEHFVVRQHVVVAPGERLSVARNLRGGNWAEGRDGENILPCVFLFCDDGSPAMPDQSLQQYPHLDNMNMLKKHEYRKRLAALAGRNIYGVHSSDNVAEACYMRAVLKEVGLAD